MRQSGRAVRRWYDDVNYNNKKSNNYTCFWVFGARAHSICAFSCSCRAVLDVLKSSSGEYVIVFVLSFFLLSLHSSCTVLLGFCEYLSMSYSEHFMRFFFHLIFVAVFVANTKFYTIVNLAFYIHFLRSPSRFRWYEKIRMYLLCRLNEPDNSACMWRCVFSSKTLRPVLPRHAEIKATKTNLYTRTLKHTLVCIPFSPSD